MFKFGGWKASLNFSGSGRRREVYDNGPDLSSGGAYRSHREELFGRNGLSEPPKKLTPSMVKLPPSKEIKSSKSANDLTQQNLPPQLRKSSPDVSTDPRGGTSNDRGSSALYQNAKNKGKDTKKEIKEKKNAEKKLAEEKKKELKLAQEQAKKDKIRIQAEKKIAEKQAKDVKSRKEKSKKTQSLPQATVSKTLVPKETPQATVTKSLVSKEKPQATVTKSLVSKEKPQATVTKSVVSKEKPQTTVTKSLVTKDIPQPAQRANPLGQSQYSTNTLESSISRSSGPPPYEAKEKQPNNRDATGNTSFSKPIEDSSWDMISEHRSQISRNPVPSGAKQKQVVMDLQFSFDKAQADDRNSEV